MLNQIKRVVRGRVGPVGLSLATAALTAVAFAAVSVAKDGGNGGGGEDVLTLAPAGQPQVMLRLSDEDREAMEEFRSCMEEQGIEPPPRPDGPGGEGEGGEERGSFEMRLEPPSDAERAEIEKALSACEEMLPEHARGTGPVPCGPPPGDGEGAAVPAPPPGAPQEGSGSATS
jgi:hypothetical protein